MKRGGQMKRTQLRRKRRLSPGTGLARGKTGGRARVKNSLAKPSAIQGISLGPPRSDLQVTEGARPGQKPRRETGFPPAVKLLVRTRAGLGDAENAACEACGIWLGRYGGQVQHIWARGMGGSRRRNKVSGACLLCGTPQTGCHGLCESRDPHLRAMGFWRLSSDEPGPVMIHGEQGGCLVWLTDDGQYAFEPVSGAVA